MDWNGDRNSTKINLRTSTQVLVNLDDSRKHIPFLRVKGGKKSFLEQAVWYFQSQFDILTWILDSLYMKLD